MNQQETTLRLNHKAQEAIGILYAGGFEAFAVGGCVRDMLMGREPNDWDIAASSTPEETRRCFSGYKTFDTGIRHGTVTVMLGNDPVEITTYRADGAYTDHRRPDSVAFSKNIADDLSRRDFTVNAMAYNSRVGLIDFFGGREDIKSRRIKAVGDPFKRFDEDALRILRGLRFSAALDFDIEPETSAAILSLKRSLRFVSRERICAELKKLMAGPAAYRVLNAYRAVFFEIIPQLRSIENVPQNTPYHSMDVWGHTLSVVKNCPPRPGLRLAALFHDLGKGVTKTTDLGGVDHFYGHGGESARLAEEILEELKFDKATASRVVWLVEHHGEPLPLTPQRIKKLLNRVPEDWVEDLIALMRADNESKNKSVAEERMPLFIDAVEILQNIREQNQCFRIKDLAVHGGDLISIGFKPGKELGKALNALLDSVINGAPNDRTALLDIAGKLLTMYSQGRN